MSLRAPSSLVQVAAFGAVTWRLRPPGAFSTVNVLQQCGLVVRHFSRPSLAAVTPGSSIEEVCAWAATTGLSAKSVDILPREEIDGAALFNLTDAVLEKMGMVVGARMNLLAAVARIRSECLLRPVYLLVHVMPSILHLCMRSRPSRRLRRFVAGPHPHGRSICPCPVALR